MSNVIEFPWEHTAEGRARQQTKNWLGYVDFTDPDSDFTAVLDWSMFEGYFIESGDIEFEINDVEASVEFRNSPDQRISHRTLNLLSDIEHLALAAIEQGDDHDLKWLEHQLEQIRTTMALDVIPLGDDDDD